MKRRFRLRNDIKSSSSLPDYDAVAAAFDSLYVAHPHFDHILNVVVTRIKRHERRGKKGSHKSLLVTGHPNVGKSTLVKKIMSQFPRVKDGREVRLADGTVAVCDYIPVLYVECPTKASEKTLVHEFLHAMDDPLWNKRDLQSSKRVLKSYIAAAGIFAVVVDEAHRPTDRRGQILQRDIATLFQQLHDWGTLIVLLGLGRADALLKQDRQVGRRWSTPVRFAEYQWGLPQTTPGPESRRLFWGLLKTMAGKLLLHWSPQIDFENEEHVFRFYYASRGLTGYLHDLFLAEINLLEERNETTITWETLAEGFENEFMLDTETGKLVQSDLQNPFRETFVPKLPPPLDDDSSVLYPAPRQTTKKQRRADLTARLTTA